MKNVKITRYYIYDLELEPVKNAQERVERVWQNVPHVKEEELLLNWFS